ncbi:hypothetical protein ACHQM5_016139 [Ranunculus cassubicifolius]
MDDQIREVPQNVDHNMHIDGSTDGSPSTCITLQEEVANSHVQSLNLSGRKTAIGDDRSVSVTEAGEPDEQIGNKFILPSSRRNIDTLWEWLKDKHIRQKVIMIHGEAGIGKTWTARQLLHRAIAEKLFEVCIWFGR